MSQQKMEFVRLSPEEVKMLPIREKIEYQKKLNTERQKKYRENNKEKLKEYSKQYAKKYKENHYEHCKEIAKKNSQKYRDKMKKIKIELMMEDICNDIINSI